MDTLNASNEISSMVINMLICHLKSECLCSVTGWHVRPLCLAHCGSQALDIKRFLICMNIEAADGLCPPGHRSSAI